MHTPVYTKRTATERIDLIASSKKAPIFDRGSITETGDDSILHNEARKLLVEGYEATHDAEGIAKAYSVSKWTVYRLTEQKRKTGNVKLRTSQRDRKPVLTAEDKENIRDCIDADPDITIEEIREKLNLSNSYSTVERTINATGYTLKKESLYASERDRVRCAGKAQRVERNHNA